MTPMSSPAPAPASARRFAVHARHEPHGHAHSIAAQSFEEAAVAFVERWGPAMDADGDVSVLVADQHGVERCFRIDIASGEAAPCR